MSDRRPTFEELIIENENLKKQISDIKAIEFLLKESEKKYRDIYENVQEGIFQTTINGSYLSANPALAKMYGFNSSEEMINCRKDISKDGYYNPYERETFLKMIDEKGYVKGYEYEVRRKDGQKVWFYEDAKAIKDENGKIQYFEGFVVDITKYKNSEDELKESKEKYRGLSEATFDSIFISEKGICVEQNQAAEKIFGYISEEAIGRYGTDWIAIEDRATVMKNMLEGYEEPYEVTALRKDGSTFPCLLRGKMMQYKGKNMRVTSLSDISQRKESEEALKQSEERLSLIFNNTSELQVLLKVESDKKLRIVTFNQSYIDGLQSAGIPIAKIHSVIGKYREEALLEFGFPKEGIDEEKKYYQRAIETGSIVRYEQAIPSLAKIVHTDVSIVPMMNIQGVCTYLLYTSQDITERKQAELAIIENQRLGAIGEMTASIAHDFNNSLQSILGNLELAILNIELPDATIQYLKIIKTVISDAAIRVKLLQRFGGKGHVETKYLPVNLNAIITEVINQSRPLWKDDAEKNGLTIDIVTEFSEIPVISGSVGELRSAIYNIIKNCIEAMPKGGKIVIITGGNSEGIHVTITDTGIGMDEETRVRIFQPFYTTKGFELGRGLGMSGAYSIIKEHKGDIYIKNTELGKGTAIEIVLPLSKNEILADWEEITPDSKNKIKILWVEDDTIIRKSAARMVEYLGHITDTAKSGKEALELLEQNKYDIIITDIGMPEMSGWQLADIIKEKFGGKMKVAVVTGWSSEIDETIKKEHGVDYILGKPFSIEELKKLLAEAVK